MAKQKLQSSGIRIASIPDLGRVPPQCVDLEEAVLGALLNDYKEIVHFPYLKPEMFYKTANQKIYATIHDLFLKDMHPDLLIVTNRLRDLGELDEVGGPVYLTQLTSHFPSYIGDYVKIIVDKYMMRELIRLTTEGQAKSFDDMNDPTEIADWLQNELVNLFDFNGDLNANFSKSLEMAVEKIKRAAEGENISTIKTGFKKIDKTMAFRGRHICIIAGPEGSLKSKFIMFMVRGMLENEPQLAVQWFSMEDDRDEVIRAFLSMDLRLTTRELQNIEYQLTTKDLQNVEKHCAQYKRFKIEFYDQVTSMSTIVARSKRFAEHYRPFKKVIVLDNLGLIESDKEGILRDDDLAAKIKGVADRTGAFIFVVHHFTKEIARKANLDEGYRPRKEYLKGSTRILDYVQQALFVNFVRNYPDLIAEEKHYELNFIGNEEIPFTEANFDKRLWDINPQRDKETANVTDLRVETFVKLSNLLNNDTKNSKGKILTFSDIVQKYSEYSSYIDTRNKGREAKYVEKKTSILTFLVKMMYNENYTSDNNNSLRSKYLYGNNHNLKAHIDNLFIVESVKNRDNDRLNDNLLFRFIADPGYTLFKEV